MTSLRSAIYSYLTGVSAVSTLVGTRIYPMAARAGAGTPRVIHTLISEDRVHTLNGTSGYARSRVQFDVYGSTPIAAEDVAEALREAMDGYRGSWGTVFVGHCKLQDREGSYEGGVHGQGVKLYRIRCDYIIHYRETIPDLIQ